MQSIDFPHPPLLLKFPFFHRTTSLWEVEATIDLLYMAAALAFLNDV